MNALHEVLRDERSPLVLAGVERLVAIYRSLCSYRPLLDEGIDANPEHVDDQDLALRARAIADPWFASERATAEAEYVRLAPAPSSIELSQRPTREGSPASSWQLACSVGAASPMVP